ncbi:uncharacterized protein LOC117107563 isoform X2 [Anneissia japonica]|nr:uncharacterized protein LOC117107563 isoform X2 [Anneissia japonica]
MLLAVSRECTEQEKNMLQVLLRNYLSNLTEVQGAKSVLELLDMLIREGHLTRNNLDILYECIKLINAYHLQDIIRKYCSCPDIKNHEIKLIPKERQAIIACGNALTKKEIGELEFIYKLNNSRDVWDFLVKLEDKLDIGHDKTKMDQFLSQLKDLNMSRPLQKMELILKDKRPEERPKRHCDCQKRKRRLVENASRLRQAEIPDYFPLRKNNQPTMVLRSKCQDNGHCSYKKPRISDAHGGKENIPLDY